MEEGFVFYNQELFSCDHDWTPVKDPVQWWSQWVDPYLERYPMRCTFIQPWSKNVINRGTFIYRYVVVKCITGPLA